MDNFIPATYVASDLYELNGINSSVACKGLEKLRMYDKNGIAHIFKLSDVMFSPDLSMCSKRCKCSSYQIQFLFQC